MLCPALGLTAPLSPSLTRAFGSVCSRRVHHLCDAEEPDDQKGSVKAQRGQGYRPLLCLPSRAHQGQRPTGHVQALWPPQAWLPCRHPGVWSFQNSPLTDQSTLSPALAQSLKDVGSPYLTFRLPVTYSSGFYALTSVSLLSPDVGFSRF